MTSKYILGAAAALFVVGGSVIVYYGRPVMKLPAPEAPEVSIVVVGEPTGGAVAVAPVVEPQVPTPVSPTPAPAPTPSTPTPAPGTYTLATIATHNTEADCWSAINGSVYDLTTWVSRHPGGTNPIVRLCGTDGSTAFTRKHGSTPKPQAALVLLKIGTLQP